ncbi:MAG TPA: hypothetical protein VGT02_01135 [Methylomirabilota bacterium]|nr:hypothetical protein [Methylomirabilota bacterium]
MWLGERRGELSDWVTQCWVRLTGRRIDLGTAPWLAGPVGAPRGIGRAFFDDLAAAGGLRVVRPATSGLVPDLGALAGPDFDPARVHPRVRDFYEHTSAYELDAWAEWCGVFRPFGWALARLFSRRLQQLNVPLSALDTSRGLTSAVLQLVDPATGAVRHTAWLRELRGSGDVLYAGTYSIARAPGYGGACVKVVFPLPNGNAVVLMRPMPTADGSLSIVSSGARFGDPGFYFTVVAPDRAWARYVRTMRETIRVYADGEHVRADHTLTIWRTTFLRLHYRLRRRA